jgi:hypothetical protein
MKKIFLLTALISTAALNAQNTATLPGERTWSFHSVLTNVNVWGDPVQKAFQSGIVYTSPTEAIVPVRYKKWTYGLMKINNEGNVLWEIRIPNNIIGLGKLKENLVVFYTPETYPIRVIHAAVINPADGKKLKENTVYENEKAGNSVKVVNKPSGQFSHLSIRLSDNMGERFPTRTKDYAIRKLTAVYLDAELNPKLTEVKLLSTSSQYLGSIANEEGHFFTSMLSSDELVVERFDRATGQTEKLSTPFKFNSKADYFPVMTADLQNNHGIFMAMHYEGTDKDARNQLYHFDFSTKKILLAPEEKLNGSYAKTLDPVKVHNGPTSGLGSIEHLQVIDILQTGDKLIGIKEIKWFDISSNDRFHEALVVSIYDRKLNLLKNLTYNKKLQTSSSAGRSLGYHVQNGKLYIILNALTSVIGTYGTMLLVINLDNMSFEKTSMLEKNKIGDRVFAESGASLWFANELLISNIVPKKEHYSVDELNTIFQKVAF